MNCRVDYSNFAPSFSVSSVVQGDEAWGLWSVHHKPLLLLLPLQGEGSSCSSPAPLGVSPMDTILHELLQSDSFHGEQFLLNFSRIFLTKDSILQEQAAPPWGSQTCSSLGFSWGHSLLQASTCSISILMVDLSIPVPRAQFLQGCRAISASPVPAEQSQHPLCLQDNLSIPGIIKPFHALGTVPTWCTETWYLWLLSMGFVCFFNTGKLWTA